MQKAKVYFSDLHTAPGKNLLDKLENLIRKAGILSIDFKKKFTAIKIHFGEPGNLSFIRPNYVARIAKLIQNEGGLPFVTDANTLYKGRRANAVDHLQSAMENGFNYMTLGCHTIIADGLKGTEYRLIEINKKNCKTAKIGSAIADADIIISMNHFKGHEMTGFGGALKNIGMGSGSIGGKLEMHSNSQPVIERDKCVGCQQCVKNCNYIAVKMDGKKKAVIDYSICVGCGQCVAVCQYDAARVNWNGEGAAEKIAEYAYAVTLNKPHFHINFLIDISPNCDCWPANDVPVAPNIGILASFDPVALDRASNDLVTKAPDYPGSLLDNREHKTDDKFDRVFPDTDWRITLKYAESLGLGTQEYDLITV